MYLRAICIPRLSIRSLLSLSPKFVTGLQSLFNDDQGVSSWLERSRWWCVRAVERGGQADGATRRRAKTPCVCAKKDSYASRSFCGGGQRIIRMMHLFDQGVRYVSESSQFVQSCASNLWGGNVRQKPSAFLTRDFTYYHTIVVE